MKKELQKTPVHYDEMVHIMVMHDDYEISLVFNQAVAELEAIIKAPIQDYEAFKNDVLGYSIEAIKKTFPKPFDMGLGIEGALKMLSIDFSELDQLNQILKQYRAA